MYHGCPGSAPAILLTTSTEWAGTDTLSAIFRWGEMEGSMRGEIIYEYQKLDSKDQKSFVAGFGLIQLSERHC